MPWVLIILIVVVAIGLFGFLSSKVEQALWNRPRAYREIVPLAARQGRSHAHSFCGKGTRTRRDREEGAASVHRHRCRLRGSHHVRARRLLRQRAYRGIASRIACYRDPCLREKRRRPRVLLCGGGSRNCLHRPHPDHARLRVGLHRRGECFHGHLRGRGCLGGGCDHFLRASPSPASSPTRPSVACASLSVRRRLRFCSICRTRNGKSPST